jgi:ribosome biogenesis protein Nip4
VGSRITRKKVAHMEIRKIKKIVSEYAKESRTYSEFVNKCRSNQALKKVSEKILNRVIQIDSIGQTLTD